MGGVSHLPLITYFSLFSGQFLEELSKFSSLSYKLRAKKKKQKQKQKRGKQQGEEGAIEGSKSQRKGRAGEPGWREDSSSTFVLQSKNPTPVGLLSRLFPTAAALGLTSKTR